MKTLLTISTIIFLFSIGAFPQKENKTKGRGQESGITERIKQNPENVRIIDSPHGSIVRPSMLTSEYHPERKPPKGLGVPIEGDGWDFCIVTSPVDTILVDNVYQPSLLELALQCIENENFNGAIEFLNEAIKDDPFSSELYFLRGKAYLETCDYIRAKTDFSTVNVLEPQFAEAYYYRGMSNLFLGDKQLAIVDFKMAASLGDILAEKFILKYSN